MKQRPHSVTIIGCLFGIAGLLGLAYRLTEFNLQHPFENAWVLFVRLLAIIGGVFLLYGKGWARWLLLIWLAYHVILSAFYTINGLVIHTLLLAVIAYFLFRPQVSSYLRV